MVGELLVILALVLANGVLAGAEIAIIAVRPTRLKELVASGSGAARAVLRLREHPERFLATVQIGITVVGATAGAFGGATVAEDLAPLIARSNALAPWADELSLALVVTLVSYLGLVVGELVPKSLALKAAEPYALLAARPLVWLSHLTKPLVWFLTASSNLVLRPFSDRTSFVEARLSPDELAQLLEESTRVGALNPQAGDIAARALRLPELVARDVMVPRPNVVVLRRGASREELRQVLLEHTHSRFPVIDGTVDKVVGYVSVKHLLALAWEEPLVVLEDLVRPAFFVPETKPVVDLLTEMRTRRTPFGVVVDERGGMAGIVTLEDLVEELVGEIFSEHVRQVPELFHREADGTVTVLGQVAVRDINRELGVALPEEGGWTTVAGLCLALARRIPVRGERLTTADGVVLEVIEASPRSVHAVRIHPASKRTDEPGPG
ncbi:MAG: HlyC/CorC family transporter [Myxococcaceae bacterium]|nr:HlyC/CorC family transporter [Myxococcaceae bacterium]